MKLVPDKLYNIWRKHFGSYALDDPRPIAEECPYTFYIPPDDHLNALETNDLVQLIFRGSPIGLEFNAERMWVKIVDRNEAGIVGELDNDPFDMPQLKSGDVVKFLRHHVIDIEWDDPSSKSHLVIPAEKQVWDRCIVDDIVLSGDAEVEYLYREDPDMADESDKYPDSGWRIRGDSKIGTDEEFDNRTASYIAIGKVLNKDDSWLQLIDAPIGARFIRNFESGEYEPVDQEE